AGRRARIAVVLAVGAVDVLPRRIARPRDAGGAWRGAVAGDVDARRQRQRHARGAGADVDRPARVRLHDVLDARGERVVRRRGRNRERRTEVSFRIERARAGRAAAIGIARTAGGYGLRAGVALVAH